MDRGVRDGNTDWLVDSKLFPCWNQIGNVSPERCQSLFFPSFFGEVLKFALKIERLMTDSVNVLREPALVPLGVPSLHSLRFRSAEYLFRHAGAWSSSGGCTALGTSLRHFSEADHYGMFGPCTAVYLGRCSCEAPLDTFGFSERHPFPPSSITPSSYAGPGPPGHILTQPFVHWYTISNCFRDGLCRTGTSWTAAATGQYGYNWASVSWRS